MTAEITNQVNAIIEDYDPDAPKKTAEKLRDLWLQFEPKSIDGIKAEQRAQQETVGIPVPVLKAMGKAIGKVLEFSGEGLSHLNMDERATLTNMAVEAGATTGIIEPDDVTAEYLVRFRGWNEAQARAGFLKSDDGASYDATFEIDLTSIRPMIATPGDPRNGVPFDALEQEGPVEVQIAYGGSCTGGKMADLDMYAAVLAQGLERGLKVKSDVELYIQFGSQRIKRYAEEKGYLDVFAKAGAETINPSCGACVNAGPGVSRTQEQVTVSAINRNFPGRSGPGHVYLASPRVVAASALAGKIVTPEALFAE